jgi:hypothetical protein
MPNNLFQRGIRCKAGVQTAAALLVALHVADAVADDDAAARMFSFSGFGTFGLVHSSEQQADFTSTIFKPNGAGYSRAWSADVDSLIAGQVIANFTPKVSAVLQVVSEQNYDNTYRPHVEWANVKYQFTPDFSARIGRTALPVFMLTDSRLIGYANPWVRPPIELYGLSSITSNDGVDASYRLALGSAINTVQVSAGQTDFRFPTAGGSGVGHARDLAWFVDTFERGFTTLRVSYGETRVTVPLYAPLFDAFREFGPEGTAIADKYDVNRRLVRFLGLGASYDPGTWFVMGEWGDIDSDSIIGDNSGWYVSSGYRFGKFTPYVTFAARRADSTTSDPGLTLAGLPPVLAGTAGALNASLNSQLGTRVVQNTLSIGSRWDFTKNAALKLQLEHTRHGAGSAGTLINVQPGFQPGGGVNVISATIDFVF